jgi:hypothetical protein
MRQAGSGWQAKCPAHEDRRASLSIGTGADDRTLLKCHAGFSLDAILSAARLSREDLFEHREPRNGTTSRIVATYNYQDEGGGLLYQVCRMFPKNFRQRRPSGNQGWIWNLGTVRRVLYRLPALQGQSTAYVVEGEKDADRLADLGLAGTTGAGGAGKWRVEYVEQLRAATVERVVVIPDNDNPGRAHAEKVASSCYEAGLVVHILELPGLPPKGDISDWLNGGGTLEQLRAMVAAAPRCSPSGVSSAETPHSGRSSVSAPLHTLDQTIATFRRWLSLEDASPVMAVAAALVANRAPGDPVWLLLVCAPSTGKTEILSATSGLPWVIPAAKVTEASLLSGTSKKERTKDATGGLLRLVGEFGVLLAKDFTSVLAQNADARNEAMAALRETYDGEWHRPVGTDGGRVLSWKGKCGLIGGVTPALDQYSQVLTALGDRFVLLRMPDADVDEFGAAALRHGDQEQQMRNELRLAIAGLVEHTPTSHVNKPRTREEGAQLVRLAAYTARARTAVARDSHHDVLYLPQVEGPGRLVKAYARLLGGLEAIGCNSETAWATLTRIAVDCAPALRTRFIRAVLAQDGPARTSDIAAKTGTVTKTASRYLEDLSLLKLVERRKLNAADNSPDLWIATPWLRQYFPESETNKYPPAHQDISTGVELLEQAPDNPVPPGVGDGPTFQGDEETSDGRF